MTSEDCLGARFEILLDGMTQSCRDTMHTAMGAAAIIKRQQRGCQGPANRPTDRIAYVGDGTTVIDIPGGKYIGRRVGIRPRTKPTTSFCCQASGGWIDC